MMQPVNRPEIDVEQEVRKIASVVATARRLLADGKMIDLSALEEKVRVLFDVIRRETPSDPEKVRVSMETIIADLDQLADDLRHRFGAMLPEGEMPQAPHVTAAYRRTSEDT